MWFKKKTIFIKIINDLRIPMKIENFIIQIQRNKRVFYVNVIIAILLCWTFLHKTYLALRHCIMDIDSSNRHYISFYLHISSEFRLNCYMIIHTFACGNYVIDLAIQNRVSFVCLSHLMCLFLKHTLCVIS